jgi:hypothetical protein
MNDIAIREHADRLEHIAAATDRDGHIGGHPMRGHDAVLRATAFRLTQPRDMMEAVPWAHRCR